MDSTSPHKEKLELSPNDLKAFEASACTILNGRSGRDAKEVLVAIQLLRAGWKKGGTTVIKEENQNSSTKSIHAEHGQIAALNKPFTPPPSTTPMEGISDRLVATTQAKEEQLGLGHILAGLYPTNNFTPPSSIPPTKCLSYKLVDLPQLKEEQLSQEEQTAVLPGYITEDDERVVNFVKRREILSPVDGEPPHFTHSYDSERSSVHGSFCATVSPQESASSRKYCSSCEASPEKIYPPTAKKAVLDPAAIARWENLDDAADWTLFKVLVGVANVAIVEQDDSKTNLTSDNGRV